jgi:hypothetical protein
MRMVPVFLPKKPHRKYFFAGMAAGFCGGGCARIYDWLARFLHIFLTVP